MTSLRLLADDLTGALDSAAEFVGLTGSVSAFWHGSIPRVLPANAALDSGTRELDAAEATTIVRQLAPHLAGGGIAFKKIDSLLRGPTIAELAACMGGDGWQYCALAPAFPFQARITRGGRQYVRDDNADGRPAGDDNADGRPAGDDNADGRPAGDDNADWRPAGGDLVSALRAMGVKAQPGRLDEDLQPGINVFDAATDDDLRRVVATARSCLHPVLWSGTGGLAQALAAGTAAPALPPLPQPILGLFGSDQSVTANQLAACAPHPVLTHDGDPATADAIARSLAATGIALANFAIPPGASRTGAAGHIARHIDHLMRALDKPGTLIAAGGETLRKICQSVGATSLEVQGRIVPGVPRSIMRGGRWNGVTVVSKSGAFGHTHLLRDLITAERKAS